MSVALNFPALFAERVRSNADTAETSLLLTALYPNGDAIAALDGTANGHVRYERNSVDATDLASAPTGLKTMVNCFHHMRPEQASKSTSLVRPPMPSVSRDGGSYCSSAAIKLAA